MGYFDVRVYFNDALTMKILFNYITLQRCLLRYFRKW